MPKPICFEDKSAEEIAADEAQALALKKKDQEAASAAAQGALMRAGESLKTFEALTGASLVDRNKREIFTQLISEGPGNQVDRNYYTEAFIRDVVKKYEGARAYLNHDTQEERRTRSEGDVRRLCGYYHDLKAAQVRDKKTGALVWAAQGILRCDESEAGEECLAKAEAQIKYSKLFPNSPSEYCGLSINGGGIKEGEFLVEGLKWNKIVGVGQADSVDCVTRPARGGAFLAIVESANGAPTLKTGEDMKVRQIIKLTTQITEASRKLVEESDAEKRKLIEAELEDLNSQLEEASKKKETDAEEADPKDDEMDAEEAEEAAKHMPKLANESEEAFKGRMTKVKAAFKKGKAKESVQGMTADDLRRKNPRLFEAVAQRVKASVESTSEDISVLKKDLREARESARNSEIELTILRDTQEAEKLLAESAIPKKILTVADLIGRTTEEKKREIERVTAMLEAAGGGRSIQFSRGAGSGQGGSGLKDKVAKLKESAGVTAA